MPSMNLRTSTITVAGIDVKIGEGNLTYTESRPLEYLTQGNEISEVREAAEVPLDLKMDFIWERVSGTGGFKELIEKITGRSYTSLDTESSANTQDEIGISFTSSDPVECRPFACDVSVKFPITCGATPTYKYYHFLDFRYENLDFDIKAGTVSLSGKCNIPYPQISASATPTRA